MCENFHYLPAYVKTTRIFVATHAGSLVVTLRDIDACLRAQIAKLYHMGIRGRVSRSTLAEANEMHDR